MKRTHWILSGVLMATGMMFSACDPEGTAQRNHIDWLLNSPEGPNLTAEQIVDSMKAYNAAGGAQMLIPFTLTDIDVLPRTDGYYVNAETGSSLKFNLDTTDDIGYSIGTVDVDIRALFVMGSADGNKSYTDYVQPRGNSLYTIYNLQYNEIESAETDSLASDTLVTEVPKRIWEHALIYVYPSGDSIITTSGDENTTHLFILE